MGNAASMPSVSEQYRHLSGRVKNVLSSTGYRTCEVGHLVAEAARIVSQQLSHDLIRSPAIGGEQLMQTKPTVTFDDLPVDATIRDAAMEHIAVLEAFHDRITGCHVVISQPHHHHRSGTLWSIRVDVVLPGAEIIVNHEHSLDHTHEDVTVAMRDAFLAVRRQLEEHCQRHSGIVKRHTERARGRISKFFPERGYGFLETPDGREIYFHEHAIPAGRLHDVTVGTLVTYTEEDGEQGPQAASVRLSRRSKTR